MSTILCIETSTPTCSVALSVDGKCIALKETEKGRSHSSLLTAFIDEVLTVAMLRKEDLDAVAISNGPGSYTGLRIGMSTAKGLCFGLDIPLIQINSLKSMANQFLRQNPTAKGRLIPMIDARRMEVFAAMYDEELNLIMESQPVLVTEDKFNIGDNNQTIYLFGTGAFKCEELFLYNRCIICNERVISANGLVELAAYEYGQESFGNLAYAVPNYYKEFYDTRNKALAG